MRLLLLATLLFVWGQAAHPVAAAGEPAFDGAPIEAVLIPERAAGGEGMASDAPGLAARASRLPGVVAAEPVFDEGERGYLAASGERSLAQSVKLRLRDTEAYERLARWLRVPDGRKGEVFPGVAPLKARLERNARLKAHANPEQWGLRNTGAPQEVEVTDIVSRAIRSVPGEDAGLAAAPPEVAGRRIRVAVVDTGADLAHPALQAALHRTESECRALEEYRACMRTSPDKEPCHARYARLDTDGNGYPLDCQGWNVVGDKDARTGIRGNNDPADDFGHGTHVAGIVGASGFVSGVASQVEILPVRVMGREGSSLSAPDATPPGGGDPRPDPRSDELVDGAAFADMVARGVLYAIRTQAQVINLSLGYSIHDDSELMRRMVELAQAQGVVVVAAAGNESSRMPVYPCRYKDVVCVASFSADGSISHFSDYGDGVEIAAPGHKILSSTPTTQYPVFFTERKGYDFKSGTSMAAPFVSGLIARLLNAGFPPDEAVARLLLGARPHLPPTAMAELRPKFTLSGNADLGRAFGVAPQPLILPALKEPVLLVLDRMRKSSVTRAPFQLALKNRWRRGERVRVELRLDPRSEAALAGLRFAGGGYSQAVEFADWGPGEERKVEGELSWAGVRSLQDLPGDFYFEVKVTGPGMLERRFPKAAEFVVPVRRLGEGDPASEDPAFRRVGTDLNASSLPADWAIKPISCLRTTLLDPRSSDGLLVVGRSGRFTTLQLLAESGQGDARFFRKQGASILDGSKESLLTFACLDQNLDGERDYVIASASPADKKFAFTFHDSSFRRKQRLEFSSETVALPEDYRWLAGVEAGSAELMPGWIARGKLPTGELPAFDPWERRPESSRNPADQRLYVLGKSGLRTVAPPAGYRLVGFLRPTATQLREGSATVLLYKGQDYLLDFHVAELKGLRFEDPRPLQFSLYHRLAGLRTMPVLALGGALDPASDVSGTAFAEESSEGRMRLSIRPSTGRPDSERVRALMLAPVKPGDSITGVLALFGDSDRSVSAYFRSRFELYFQDGLGGRDGGAGRTLATDLKQFDSVTRHLPARVGESPALLIPEGQGGSIASEVILPRDGTLWRPAALKTLGAGGCELIQMLSTSNGGAGGGETRPLDRLIYFCSDHFVEVAY